MLKRLDSANDFKRNKNSAWDWCAVCGQPLYTALLYFENGSSEPVEGETVTGVESGDTGVVTVVEVMSGSWAGGDAAGYMTLEDLTGENKSDYEIFTAGESLDGSEGGDDFAVVKYDGTLQVHGLLYPDEDLVEYKGKKYCRPHFLYRWGSTFKEEALPDITEQRGEKK